MLHAWNQYTIVNNIVNQLYLNRKKLALKKITEDCPTSAVTVVVPQKA